MLKVARKRLFTQLSNYNPEIRAKGTFCKSLSCKRGGGAMFTGDIFKAHPPPLMMKSKGDQAIRYD